MTSINPTPVKAAAAPPTPPSASNVCDDNLGEHSNDNQNTSNNHTNANVLIAATTTTAFKSEPAASTSATTIIDPNNLSAEMQAKLANIRMTKRSNEPKEEDIRLVRMVKLYPSLYDRSDENYGKKKSSEQTWEIISQAMNQPVSNCKDRWRNIRAAFMRSIDCYKTLNGPNRSKDYYLKNELTFLRECAEKQKLKGLTSNLLDSSSSRDIEDDDGMNATNSSSNLLRATDNTQHFHDNFDESSQTELKLNSSIMMQSHQQQQRLSSRKACLRPNIDAVESLAKDLQTPLCSGETLAKNTMWEHCQRPSQKQEQRPRLIPRATAHLIETPTSSYNQAKAQMTSSEQNSSNGRVTISTPSCNGFQATLSRHSAPPQPQQQQPKLHTTIPIPIQLPFQLPLHHLPPSTTCSSAASSAYQRAPIHIAFSEQQQEEKASAAAADADNDANLANLHPTKRRRSCEYDDENDTFTRVHIANKWSEEDPDALFLRSLYVRMGKLNEDQNLHFQCLVLKALREVQNNNNDDASNNNRNNITPKATTAPSMTTSSCCAQIATPSTTPHANSATTTTNLTLNRLYGDQSMQVQQFAKQHASPIESIEANSVTNGHTSEDDIDNVSVIGDDRCSSNGNLPRADLSNMVFPFLIKDEPFDTGH